MQGLFVVFCPQNTIFSPNFHLFPPKNIHYFTIEERVLGDDEARQLHADETANIVRMDDKTLKNKE